MVLANPPLELGVLARDEVLGGEVGVVRVVLGGVVPALSCRDRR